MVEGLLRVSPKEEVFDDEQEMLKKVYETKSGLTGRSMDSPKQTVNISTNFPQERKLLTVKFRLNSQWTLTLLN